MRETRFERYLREIAPYWEEYLATLKAKGKNPPPGLVDCFDDGAYKVFKEHADLILAKIIAEEQSEKDDPNRFSQGSTTPSVRRGLEGVVDANSKTNFGVSQ